MSNISTFNLLTVGVAVVVVSDTVVGVVTVCVSVSVVGVVMVVVSTSVIVEAGSVLSQD